MSEKRPSIMVIGAGISGVHTALELADAGCRVHLVERTPAVGGILTRLDRQFPNDHCGMCRVLNLLERDTVSSVCLRKGVFHKNITLHIATEVLSIEGRTGNYTAALSKQAAGVDPDKCTGCGKCLDVCPVVLEDPFNENIGKRKAIYYPDPYKDRKQPIIDTNACTDCGECVKACPTDAIDLKTESVLYELKSIVAVIYTTGVSLYNPGETDLYGFGYLPNVVTATAFERILSGNGPFQGYPVRPSDGGRIKRVAWLQCIGSRNLMTGADDCSSACCMFAVKEAIMAKETLGKDTETTIFYMDMRTFGRDFQRYRDRAEIEMGVRFVRCRVHSVEPASQSGELKISYLSVDGKQITEIFDLVVLSTGGQQGQEPTKTIQEGTDTDGIFYSDSCGSMQDISGAIVNTGASVIRTIRMMHQKGMISDSRFTDRKPVPSWDYFEQRPKTLAVVCVCERNNIIHIDPEILKSMIHEIYGRVECIQVQNGCMDTGWEEVKSAVIQTRPNRMVFAACQSKSLGSRIEELETELGFPPYLINIVDIQSILDRRLSESETIREIMAGVEMSISRLQSKKKALENISMVNNGALVIGAGISGMRAAYFLAECGVPVTIVEKGNTVGGNLVHIYDPEIRKKALQTLSAIENHSHIQILLKTEVKENTGIPGQFVTRLEDRSGRETLLTHGATIIATGGKQARYQPDDDLSKYYLAQFSLGLHKNIMTHFDLDKHLAEASSLFSDLKTLVMIQCAGLRKEPLNFCSRICCEKALKNALKILELNRDVQIYIFYRDMMTYGKSERLYTRTRKKGVSFFPYDVNDEPMVVVEDGNVVVKGYDPILNEKVKLKTDLVSLATGIVPNPVDDLKKIFNLRETRDGFIREVDSKWRPVDTEREGVFICGLARTPLRAEEAMREGEAAAQRALRLLMRKEIHPQRQTAQVHPSLCAMCEMCMDVCSYHARYIDTQSGQIKVDPVSCRGCGACAAVCPSGATRIDDFEDAGILNAIEAGLLL